MDGLNQNSQLLVYQSPDGAIKIDARLEENMVCRNFRHTTQHGAGEKHEIHRGKPGVLA